MANLKRNPTDQAEMLCPYSVKHTQIQDIEDVTNLLTRKV